MDGGLSTNSPTPHKFPLSVLQYYTNPLLPSVEILNPIKELLEYQT